VADKDFKVKNGLEVGDHISLPDNKQIQLGDGNDGTIHHDGSHFRLRAGTGNFNVQTNDFHITDASNDHARFVVIHDGETRLYHNANVKLATSSSGGALTGVWTGNSVTQGVSSNNTAFATTEFVTRAVNNLIDGAPGTLNTLNEIAAAVNDDPNYVGTINSALALKAPLSAPTFTGLVTFNPDSDSGLTIGNAGTDAMAIYTASGDELYMGQTGAYKLRFTAAGNIVMDNGGNFGVGTATPDAWLQIERDNNNAGNQFSVADTEGVSPAVRTYTHNGDPAGLILNHYYAVSGSGNEYMRYADFVANVGNGAGTTMRFITKNAANTFSVGLAQDNNGNVGIGETSPDGKLHIKGGTATGDQSHILFENTQGSKVYSVGGGATGLTNNNLWFRNVTDNTRLMVVTDVGKVGIGTDSPNLKLHVEEDADTWVGEFKNVRSAGGYGLRIDNSGAGGATDTRYALGVYTPGNSGFFIRNNGDIGMGQTAPAHLLDILKTGSGDATINIKSTTGGDPTLIFDSAAANRNAVIRFKDQGSTVAGRIQYVHNGDRMDFQAGSGTGSSMAIKNGKVGVGPSVSPSHPFHVESSEAKTAFINRTSGSNAANLGEFNTHYALSILNRGSGSYLNFGGNGSYSALQATNMAGTPTAKQIVLNPHGGNVGIGMTSAINSKLSVFGDGEVFRIDGSANTSRTMRFRNCGANGTSNAILVSDGILEIKTEDANAHIYISAVRDIAYTTTSANGTAGDHVFKSYNTEIMRLDGGNNRISMGGPNGGAAAKLHIDGATSSQPALMLEGNTNGDVIALQLKAKANNGTLSYHGLTASPGSDQDDNIIALGNGGNNGVVVNHKNVVTARYVRTHDAPGASSAGQYDIGGNYLGANGAGFGTHAIFRTPSVASPSSGPASTQFLTVYSSGHWGEYALCKFRVYTTYYSGTYREYLFRMAGSSTSLQEVQYNGTSSSFGVNVPSITKGSSVDTGADHSGQNIYKCELTFTSGGAYQRDYVVMEISYGANKYYSSATSHNTMDALTNGGKYHFKTISVGEGRGQMYA